MDGLAEIVPHTENVILINTQSCELLHCTYWIEKREKEWRAKGGYAYVRTGSLPKNEILINALLPSNSYTERAPSTGTLLFQLAISQTHHRDLTYSERFVELRGETHYRGSYLRHCCYLALTNAPHGHQCNVFQRHPAP